MFSDSVLTVPNGEIFFRANFFKIGNRRRNIKLPVTEYVNQLYLTAVICPTAMEANGSLLHSRFRVVTRCSFPLGQPLLSGHLADSRG